MRNFCLRLLCMALCLLLAASAALADSYDVEIYRPETGIASAPIIMQRANDTRSTFAGEMIRPSAVIADVRLDAQGVLTVCDGDDALGTLDSVYQAQAGQVNFGVRISDADTATVLQEWVEQNDMGNLWLIAADPALIVTVREANDLVRGVVDITAGVPDMRTLYDAVYGNSVRSVLISAADASPATVRLLQEFDYMVYVDACGAMDAVTAYNLIVSGANGVLTDEASMLLSVLEGFDDYTLTRGGTIVGHRGEYTYPNNSLPSFIHAAESGAQSVELDTWYTRDGYVVLSHDDNMADTEQVAQGERDKRLTISKWETNVSQLTFAGTPYHYITLDQLFEATADEYPHLIYRIEIKDYRPKNVNAVMEIIEKYNLRERCQIICFEDAVSTMARKNGYATLYLSSPGNFTGYNDLPDAARRLEGIYRPLNSWYSSTWSNIDANVMEYMQHYGLAIQAWPTSQENDLHGHFIEGYNGMTTDYCHWANDYVKYIEASMTDGQLTVTGHLYDGTTKDLTAWAEPVEVAEGVMAVRVRITLPTDYPQKWYYAYSQTIAAE